MSIETPIEHQHDWPDSHCECGASSRRMIEFLRETLAEQVAYTQELHAQLYARGIDDGKVPGA